MRDYLHYCPEFDTLVVMTKRYTSYYRDAFTVGPAKGRVKLVFIMLGDFGFTHEG
jgi:hypothetical protein